MTDKPTRSVQQPSISVIIVTLDAAGDLQACLDSIYAQKHQKVQVIIMDGGSTDGTVDIIKANADRIAFWTSEPDAGIYDAMNKALGHVTGDWVYFLGSDDRLLPGFSELAGKLKDPSCIYYGRVYITGKLTPGPLNAYKHAKDTICHQAMIYPASVFKKYKFDTRYRIAADHVLNMQCWADKYYTFKFVDVAVADFNDTGISMTKADDVFNHDKGRLIYKNYGPWIWARFAFRRYKERRDPERYKSHLK